MSKEQCSITDAHVLRRNAAEIDIKMNDPPSIMLTWKMLINAGFCGDVVSKYVYGDDKERVLPLAFLPAAIRRSTLPHYDWDRDYIDSAAHAVRYITECRRAAKIEGNPSWRDDLPTLHPRVLEQELDLIGDGVYVNSPNVLFIYQTKKKGGHYTLVHVTRTQDQMKDGWDEELCVATATIYDAYGVVSNRNKNEKQECMDVVQKFIKVGMGVEDAVCVDSTPPRRSIRNKKNPAGSVAEREKSTRRKKNPAVSVAEKEKKKRKKHVKWVFNDEDEEGGNDGGRINAPYPFSKNPLTANYSKDSKLCGALVLHKVLRIFNECRLIVLEEDTGIESSMWTCEPVEGWPVRWIVAVAMAKMGCRVIKDLGKMDVKKPKNANDGDYPNEQMILGWEHMLCMYKAYDEMPINRWKDFLTRNGCPFFQNECCTEADYTNCMVQPAGTVYNRQFCAIMQCCFTLCHLSCFGKYLRGRGQDDRSCSCMTCGTNNPRVLMVNGTDVVESYNLDDIYTLLHTKDETVTVNTFPAVLSNDFRNRFEEALEVDHAYGGVITSKKKKKVGASAKTSIINVDTTDEEHAMDDNEPIDLTSSSEKSLKISSNKKGGRRKREDGDDSDHSPSSSSSDVDASSTKGSSNKKRKREDGDGDGGDSDHSSSSDSGTGDGNTDDEKDEDECGVISLAPADGGNVYINNRERIAIFIADIDPDCVCNYFTPTKAKAKKKKKKTSPSTNAKDKDKAKDTPTSGDPKTKTKKSQSMEVSAYRWGGTVGFLADDNFDRFVDGDDDEFDTSNFYRFDPQYEGDTQDPLHVHGIPFVVRHSDLLTTLNAFAKLFRYHGTAAIDDSYRSCGLTKNCYHCQHTFLCIDELRWHEQMLEMHSFRHANDSKMMTFPAGFSCNPPNVRNRISIGTFWAYILDTPQVLMLTNSIHVPNPDNVKFDMVIGVYPCIPPKCNPTLDGRYKLWQSTENTKWRASPVDLSIAKKMHEWNNTSQDTYEPFAPLRLAQWLKPYHLWSPRTKACFACLDTQKGRPTTTKPKKTTKLRGGKSVGHSGSSGSE